MRAPAPAKLNLALVVGPKREDGKHEVVTVLQRIDLGDRVTVTPAPDLMVTGFAGDTLVRTALQRLAEAAGARSGWHATISKRIPVAAGLGAGAGCRHHTPVGERHARQAARPGRPPCARSVARPRRAVLPRFRSAARPRRRLGARAARPAAGLLGRPRRAGRREQGVDRRRLRAFRRARRRSWLGGPSAALERSLAAVRRPRDLAELPPNDLASSPVAYRLRELGAFRADVSGAGPAVYGLFHHRRHAESARRALQAAGRTWLTVPTWYG